MINVVSVRVGDKYGPEYVAILHNMVSRNLSTVDHAHWCITDDPESLPEGVNAIAHDPTLPGWWQKLHLFSADMPWEDGERVMYFDLDVCITGRLEDLPKGIIRDWLWGTYNSSVMSWDHGEHREVIERFNPLDIERPGRLVDMEALPKGQINGGDQEWITEVGGWPIFPAEMCVSYRLHATAWPPSESKVVCFHGKLKPADVVGGWVPNVWKLNGFTSLPTMTGVNVSDDHIWANIEANMVRDLPWFTGFRERAEAVAIVCGGPSMRSSLADIKAQRRRGTKIVSVNNALAFLMESGIVPDVHVMLDAREENAEFVRFAPKATKYVIASQCHPAVFEALAGRDVVVWHNAFGDNGRFKGVLGELWNTKPVILVPGGCTVGLRALWLCELSGYKKIHVYGMDSCYHDDVHHAYSQTLNDGERTLLVQMGGKEYRCARWMARQASEFQETWFDLEKLGVAIWVHGRGLIPDMARNLRQEAA